MTAIMNKNTGVKVNYYSVLEISTRAGEDVIHAAYRTLALRYKDDQKKLYALNEAKDILLDPKKREQYDNEQKDKSNKKSKIVGNYKIINEIAQGGFGRTYKGEHVTLGVPVCLKHASKVSPQDEEILMQEAQAIWDLRHFSIPSMRDILKLDDGSLVLVMSYIPGPTLHQIIEKKHKLEPEHVAWIAERVLNALKYLHYNGVVHGDIKPANIIVQPDQHQVAIVDFGLSLIRPNSNTENKGFTPHFAAPEQMNGDTLLPETDFFGLGMSMVFALGGDVKSGPMVPKNTPDGLCALIKKLIKYDILQRPNWKTEDLMKTIQDAREKDFGRRSSMMKPLVV